MPGEQIPREQMPKEQMPREQIPREQMPREQMPREQTPREQISREQMPREQIPKEQMPREQISREQIPEEHMQTSRIRQKLESAGEQGRQELYRIFCDDPRTGVQKLLAQYRRKDEKLQAERERLEKMREYEHAYEHLGYVCGIDEAGRGPLAGPVVAGAVILPKDCEILWLNDSKQLSASRREELFPVIMEKALAVGVGIVGPERIDEINILQADYEAMHEAIRQLKILPAVLLNDAVTIPEISIRQVPIIKGDSKSISIAAASVIAKVTRDRIMMEYDRQMPEYGFAAHKGYGTAAHIAAIRKYGPCPIHRKTFIHSFV